MVPAKSSRVDFAGAMVYLLTNSLTAWTSNNIADNANPASSAHDQIHPTIAIMIYLLFSHRVAESSNRLDAARGTRRTPPVKAVPCSSGPPFVAVPRRAGEAAPAALSKILFFSLLKTLVLYLK